MPIPKISTTTANTFDAEHVKAIVVAYLKKAASINGDVDRLANGLVPAQRWIVHGSTHEHVDMMWDKFMPCIEALREGNDEEFEQHLAALHNSGWLNDKQFASKIRAVKF